LLAYDVDINRDQSIIVRIFKLAFCISISLILPRVIISTYAVRIENSGLSYILIVYLGIIVISLGLQFMMFGKFQEWNRKSL
jgi:Na+(H+)/acetate symporter ActP